MVRFYGQSLMVCEAVSLVILHKKAWLNLARGERGKSEILEFPLQSEWKSQFWNLLSSYGDFIFFALHDVGIWAQISKKNTILHLPQHSLVKGCNLEFLFGIPTPLQLNSYYSYYYYQFGGTNMQFAPPSRVFLRNLLGSQSDYDPQKDVEKVAVIP